jgi:tricorn protease interacting factor F2/3
VEVKSYDLFMDIDFTGLKFNGRVLIELVSDRDVVLNSAGLEILSVSSGAKDFQFKQSGEELTIGTGAFVGTLAVDYKGVIPDSLAGIYRAPYDHTHVISTHFEAAQARRMLPCVDRPDVKAEFNVSVRVDSGLDVISNMPVASVKAEGGKKVVVFQSTPRMSTYLLYLGVGKFEEQKDKIGRIDVIVAAIPGKANLGSFALNEAKKALVSFESYYGIPYELPKLHMIAVPEFAMGAMENWGAITFRETALLIDSGSSTRAKKRVSEVVIHELAHQWFGDLVTMKWWDDIWLNESFATFMAFKVIDLLHPEWKVWEDFLIKETSGAGARDALRNTHPVQVHADSPDEIEQIFDDISYGKGASILRMVEAYVGKDVFRKGIQNYLSRYVYSNASGNDLWNMLEEASGQAVGRVMTAWVQQPGHPVVTVSSDGGKLKLRQERFLISGSFERGTWPIPIDMEVNGERRRLLFEREEETIDVGHISSLRVNLNRTGFYLVRYVGLDEVVWKSNLTAVDRWGLVADAFAFLLSGTMSFEDYLNRLTRYLQETEFLPASEVSDQIAFLQILLPSRMSKLTREFHQLQLRILQGKTDENSLILRGTVSSRLLFVDDDFADELASRFKEYDRVEPDLKQAVALAYARRTGDFDGLVKAFRSASSDEDKTRMLNSMTAFADPAWLKRSLDFAVSGEVKRQDVRMTVLAAAGKPNAQTVTWAWLRDNLSRLREIYAGTGILSGTLLGMIPILGVGRASEVEKFFDELDMPEARVGILAGLEKMRAYDRLVSDVLRSG